MFKKHIKPCTVVITSLPVRDKPLEAPSSVKRVYCQDNPTSDDVIEWKHFPRYWPYVWGIHRSPVNSAHKCQWRGALVFSLICTWKNIWVNSREAGDLWRHRGHHDVVVMQYVLSIHCCVMAYWSCNVLKTLRPRQNGRRFPDDIIKCISLNANAWVSIKISLKFVTKGPINKIPALVQIMAWRRPGAKPLSEPMVVNLLTHKCVTLPQWVKDAMVTQQAPLH